MLRMNSVLISSLLVVAVGISPTKAHESHVFFHSTPTHQSSIDSVLKQPQCAVNTILKETKPTFLLPQQVVQVTSLNTKHIQASASPHPFFDLSKRYKKTFLLGDATQLKRLLLTSTSNQVAAVINPAAMMASTKSVLPAKQEQPRVIIADKKSPTWQAQPHYQSEVKPKAIAKQETLVKDTTATLDAPYSSFDLSKWYKKTFLLGDATQLKRVLLTSANNRVSVVISPATAMQEAPVKEVASISNTPHTLFDLSKRYRTIFLLTDAARLRALVLSAHLQAATNAIDPTASMVVINLDAVPVTETTLLPLDLRHTFVSFASTSTNSALNWNIDTALIYLYKQAEKLPMIAGFEIDTQLSLSPSAARIINALAKKSVLVSLKSKFAKPTDWLSVFGAMKESTSLLSSIYGPLAAMQIQTTPGMGKAFAGTAPAFSHFYTTPDLTQKLADRFWLDTAQTLKANKQPLMMWLTDAGLKNQVDYALLAKDAIPASDGYLMMVSGENVNVFAPITDKDPSLVIWRIQGNKLAKSIYVKETSPAGLYMGMGMNQTSFTLAKQFVERAHRAQMGDIHFTAGADGGYHTYAALLGFADTVVLDGKEVSLPKLSSTSSQVKLNILVNDPEAKAIKQLINHLDQLKINMQDQHYLGIFDYTKNKNIGFYQRLMTLVEGVTDIRFTYDANNDKNLVYFKRLMKAAASSEFSNKPPASFSATNISLNKSINIPVLLATRPEDVKREQTLRRISAQAEVTPDIFSLPITLNVIQQTTKFGEKNATVFNLIQPDGTVGLVANQGEKLNIVLNNKTAKPVSIHWDGLHFSTANQKESPVIPAGKSCHYHFKVSQAGTYYLHARDRVQSQQLLAAPFIVYDPNESVIRKNVPVMLQSYVENSQLHTYLANRRTMADPQIINVLPGQEVKLRFINAAPDTHFLINTGKLPASIVAVNGASTKSMVRGKFSLLQAQRKDVLVTIPREGGTFPVLATADGSTKQTGIILSTPDAAVPTLKK